MATDLKLSKAQIKKMIQSGEFLGKLLSKLAGPLMKVAMPIGQKRVSTIRFDSCYVCNRREYSKKDAWFRCYKINN